jgi:serine/threonine-protein kinase
MAAAFAGWYTLAWVVGDWHPLPLFGEVGRLAAQLGPATFLGAAIGLAYLALEPVLRRRWPGRLTAWNRLLAGRWRDPLVGRDLLVGALIGVALAALTHLHSTLPAWLGLPAPLRTPTGLPVGPPAPLVYTLRAVGSVLFAPLFSLMLAFLLFLLLRREWLSWPATFLVYTSLNVAGVIGPSAAANAVHVLVGATIAGLVTLMLARAGLLTCAAAGVGNVLLIVPLTTDTSAWYAGQGWAGAGVVLAVAGYGCATAIGGQRLFRQGFFGDE